MVVYYGQNECSGHAAGLDFKLYGEFVPGTDSWLSLSLMDTKMKLVLGLKFFLEELFGTSVDLIRRHKNLRPFFLSHIEKDAIYVI